MSVNLLVLTTVNRAKLYQGQPGTTDAALYTAPASTDVKVTSIVICNTTNTAATLTLNVRTGAVGAANRILSAFSVAANDTVTLETPVMLTAADVISGLQGTASALTVTISGETYA
jgi:hypothetical protein